MFRRCLYWHAKLMAPLLRRLNANFFNDDIKFIRYLGASTALREIYQDLMSFRDANLGRRNLWRTVFRFRVSGRKAARLAQKLFPQDIEGSEAENTNCSMQNDPCPQGVVRT